MYGIRRSDTQCTPKCSGLILVWSGTYFHFAWFPNTVAQNVQCVHMDSTTCPRVSHIRSLMNRTTYGPNNAQMTTSNCPGVGSSAGKIGIRLGNELDALSPRSMLAGLTRSAKHSTKWNGRKCWNWTYVACVNTRVGGHVAVTTRHDPYTNTLFHITSRMSDLLVLRSRGHIGVGLASCTVGLDPSQHSFVCGL